MISAGDTTSPGLIKRSRNFQGYVFDGASGFTQSGSAAIDSFWGFESVTSSTTINNVEIVEIVAGSLDFIMVNYEKLSRNLYFFSDAEVFSV